MADLVQEGEGFRLFWLRNVRRWLHGVGISEQGKRDEIGTLFHRWTLTATF